MPQVQRVTDEADRDDRAGGEHAPINPFLILSKFVSDSKPKVGRCSVLGAN